MYTLMSKGKKKCMHDAMHDLSGFKLQTALKLLKITKLHGPMTRI